MENLLKPDLGLMIWTVVTFLIMVAVLKKVAWGPLLKTLDEREENIKAQVAAAEKGRAEMEKMKADYEAQLSQIEARAKALLAEAEQQGTAAREAILKEAQEQAHRIQEKTKLELAAERDRLVHDLRAQAGNLSVEIAERLIRKSVDKKVQEQVMEDFLKSLEAPSGKPH